MILFFRKSLRRGLLALCGGLLSFAAHAGLYEDFVLAVDLDDERTVVKLLDLGFDPNSVNYKGQPLVMAAMQDGQLKVAQRLLEAPDLKVNQRNVYGESPLMIAALKGQLLWTLILLERGAVADHAGWNALHYAATGKNVEVLEAILKRRVDVDARAPNGSTPLMMAAQYGSTEAVRRLVLAGADVTLTNAHGQTAVDYAKRAERFELAKWLQDLAIPDDDDGEAEEEAESAQHEAGSADGPKAK